MEKQVLEIYKDEASALRSLQKKSKDPDESPVADAKFVTVEFGDDDEPDYILKCAHVTLDDGNTVTFGFPAEDSNNKNVPLKQMQKELQDYLDFVNVKCKVILGK